MSWPEAAARRQINTTTNQKHAGTMKEGWYRMHDWEGTYGERDSINFGAIKLGHSKKLK